MDVIDSVELLERYSVVLLPVLVVAEQVGIPLPAVPALLGVGALAAKGRVSLSLVIGAIALVAMPVDLTWYELGRRRGARVLSGLCRLSLEPDVCVRRTQNLFRRYGVRAMLVAKFLPGLTTVMPPLAGIFGVSRLRFATYELTGVLLWAYFWAGTGFVFSETVDQIARRVAELERSVGLGIAAVLVGFVLLKYLRRWLFLRRLRIARISAEDLRWRLKAGEEITIVDLRSSLDVAAVPYAIPGSHWITVDDLDKHLSDIPRDRELILYCSCPNEATSALVALEFKRRGFTRVRPLDGGLARWMALKYPVRDRHAPAIATPTPSIQVSDVDDRGPAQSNHLERRDPATDGVTTTEGGCAASRDGRGVRTIAA